MLVTNGKTPSVRDSAWMAGLLRSMTSWIRERRTTRSGSPARGRPGRRWRCSTSVKVTTREARVTGVDFIRNELGAVDASGRRNPMPRKGSEFTAKLDTLIVTIGDVPDIEYISDMGLAVSGWGTLVCDEDTLMTNRQGVFAGGDVVTGPNTVVEAIAAGKKAAVMIHRYLRGEQLKQPAEVRLPEVLVEPVMLDEEELETAGRAEPPRIAPERRAAGFDEVELTLSVEDATREARRCLRCDLEFTQRKYNEDELETAIPVEKVAR